jgi:hypothetical protein
VIGSIGKGCSQKRPTQSNDRDRQQNEFAMHISKVPEANNSIIELAPSDPSAHMRGQALFWLSQKAGEKAVENIGRQYQIRNRRRRAKVQRFRGLYYREVAKQIANPLEISTSGGSISLAVPADFKADIEATTSGGRVACDLPVAGKIKSSSIKGKVNGGGPEVVLRTSGGNIEVARR